MHYFHPLQYRDRDEWLHVGHEFYPLEGSDLARGTERPLRSCRNNMLNQEKMVADWNQAANNQIMSAQEDIIYTIAAV